MPIDPSISLDAGSPQYVGAAGGGAPPASGLSLLGGYADLAGKMNQLKLFNQTYQARQRASELIAASPDLESGITAVLHDPVASFGAGDTINQFRQGMLALTQQQGEIQKQASTGLEATLHGLLAAQQNPANFQPTVDAYLQTLSPQARPQVAGAIDSIRKGLVANSPDQASYEKNLGALLLGAGISGDTMRAVTGALPPTVQIGPYAPGGAQQPVVMGGPATVSNQLGAGGSTGAAGAAPAPLGPSQAQTNYQEHRGADMAEYAKGLDDRTQTGSTIMTTLQEGRDALAGMKAGGGASVYAKAAQVAQAFGAPDSVVDKISNGGLAASQEFTKLMVNTTMGQIQNQVPQGSRLNQQEFKVFSANNPNLDTDPRAIEKIFNFWTRVHNRDFAEQQALAEASKRPGFDVTSWPAQWQKQMRDTGMVNVSTQAAGGQQQGPAGSATHQFVPGKGLVPIAPPQ